MLKSVKRTLLAGLNAGWLKLRSQLINAEKLWRSTEGDNYSFEMLVPFSDAEASQLPRMIESVRNQICDNWKLTLLPISESPRELTIPIDDRIRLGTLDEQITRAEAIRAGVDQSTADFVAILPPAVRLEVDTLVWASFYLTTMPQTKWLYFDHMEKDQPICKPDFSRELLFSTMFTGPLNFVAKNELKQVGQLNTLANDDEQYDLLLRLSESISPHQITHVPEFGYSLTQRIEHTRHDRTASLLEQHYAKRGIAARVELACPRNSIFKTHFETSPKSGEVTVIIPTKNQAWRLKKCMDSLRSTTEFDNYQVVVINNQSDEPELFELFKKEEHKGRFRVYDFDEPFNYARMHNVVIEQLTSKYVLLLNNDVYDFSNGWIEQLVATQNLSHDIACVGCLLRYPDGTTQHGGVSFGIGKPCRHAHLGLDATAPGYCGRMQSMQQLSAVTAALLLIDRAKYLELGGFDEINFPISYNDTDLCLKFLQAGYRTIYNPSVTALHEESVSRGKSPREKEWRYAFEEKWNPLIHSDRFYNSHLSRHGYAPELFLSNIWRNKKAVSLLRYSHLVNGPNNQEASHDARFKRKAKNA